MVLAEYALLPCIFDKDSYNSEEICLSRLENLRDILIHEEALIRDLRNGQWSKFVKQIPSQHPNTKYILQKLAKRLHRVKFAMITPPNCINQWCQEALKSHQGEPLNGIIASKSTSDHFKSETIIASIENLNKADWWMNRSHSVGLKRQTSNYLQCLKLLLNCANSLIFIDPYFDPVKYQYKEFEKILDQINRPDDPPLIEVHLCHLDSGVNVSKYEQSFRHKLDKFICSRKLEVDVFIWDYFHDRFIISDLIGIQSGHSFSVSDNPNETTTWTRISPQRRDEIQKEFDKSSRQHKLQHHFTVS